MIPCRVTDPDWQRSKVQAKTRAKSIQRGCVESDHCEALTNWRDLLAPTIPELAWLIHIPNGGKRHPAIAAQLKAEGVKAGVWDYLLPVPRNGKHGLWVEMKAPGREGEKNGGLSEQQVKFGLFVADQGYETKVLYHWHDAMAAVLSYLGVRA